MGGVGGRGGSMVRVGLDGGEVLLSPQNADSRFVEVTWPQVVECHFIIRCQ